MTPIVSKALHNIELEQAHGGAGARRVIFSAGEALHCSLQAFTRGYLEPQAAFDWHKHEDQEEFMICEQGNGLLQFEDGQTVRYFPGTAVHIPATVRHRIEAWGEETSEFYFLRIASNRPK